MKFLFVTTVSGTMNFFPEHIKMLVNAGHSVEIACSCALKPINPIYEEYGCVVHDIPFSRNPLSKNNLTSYRILKKLVEKKHFDVIHTHTPNASLIARLASRKVRKQGTKIIYTAHGFHFFKGAPVKNWLIYYVAERFCARYTDVLITINKEDYDIARKKIPVKEIYYVPGVGVDVDKILSVQCCRDELRRTIGVPENSVLFFSVGELSTRKNHQVVLHALAKLENPYIHYALAGMGSLEFSLKQIVKSLKIESKVHFLGFRKDIFALNKASDVSVLPSLQEGLPVALMEAMACGLPVICSRIRGNVDLVEHEKGGFLFVPTDVEQLVEYMKFLVDNPKKREEMGSINREVIKDYDIEHVLKKMKKIYGIV